MRHRPKPIQDVSLLSYDDAKDEHDFLEEQVSVASEDLHAFPRNAAGLVSDSIRLSPEYQIAKARYNAAFAALRKFNSGYTRLFAKELRAERAARYKR